MKMVCASNVCEVAQFLGPSIMHDHPEQHGVVVP